MGVKSGISWLLGIALYSGLTFGVIAGEGGAMAGELVQLDGSMSSDPDGDRLSYIWRQISGAKVDLLNSNTSTPSFVPQQPGKYVFELVVSDGKVSSEPARVEVVVERVNNAPIAMLPSSMKAKVGDKVMLDATASKDPDGDAMNYTWRQLSGPQYMFREKLTRGPYVSFYPQKPGKYEFELVATDGEKVSQPVRCELEVIRPNAAPVARVTTSSSRVAIHQAPLGNSGANIEQIPDELTINDLKTPDDLSEYVKLGKPSIKISSKSVNTTANTKKANSVPVASASPNMMAEPGEKVVLRGGAVDPDNDHLEYIWRQTAGPVIPGGPIHNRNLVFIPNREGIYIFELTVSDGKLSSIPAACAVTVAKDIDGLRAMRGGRSSTENINDVEVPGIDPVTVPERGGGLFSRIFDKK